MFLLFSFSFVWWSTTLRVLWVCFAVFCRRIGRKFLIKWVTNKLRCSEKQCLFVGKKATVGALVSNSCPLAAYLILIVSRLKIIITIIIIVWVCSHLWPFLLPPMNPEAHVQYTHLLPEANHSSKFVICRKEWGWLVWAFWDNSMYSFNRILIFGLIFWERERYNNEVIFTFRVSIHGVLQSCGCSDLIIHCLLITSD